MLDSCYERDIRKFVRSHITAKRYIPQCCPVGGDIKLLQGLWESVSNGDLRHNLSGFVCFVVVAVVVVVVALATADAFVVDVVVADAVVVVVVVVVVLVLVVVLVFLNRYKFI